MYFRIFTFFLLSWVNSETVHFTNSPAYLVKSKNFTTYKLEVPNSNLITIVESNDENQYQQHDGSQRDANSFKPIALKKTVFAPSLLEKFLKEYSSKVNNEMSINLKTKINEKNTKIQKLRQDRYTSFENSKQNERLKIKNSKINDREGWVTLQAIPWTKSEVSKWVPHLDAAHLENLPDENIYEKPKPDYFKNQAFSKLDNNEKTKIQMSAQNPLNLYEHDNVGLYFNRNKQLHLSPVPWNTRKVSNFSTSYQEMDTSSKNHGWITYGLQANLDNHKNPSNDEIIISEHNSNIVWDPEKKRLHELQSQHSRHPTTYPLNGNGEWVLLSATKGYYNNNDFSDMKGAN